MLLGDLTKARRHDVLQRAWQHQRDILISLDPQIPIALDGVYRAPLLERLHEFEDEVGVAASSVDD